MEITAENAQDFESLCVQIREVSGATLRMQNAWMTSEVPFIEQADLPFLEGDDSVSDHSQPIRVVFSEEVRQFLGADKDPRVLLNQASKLIRSRGRKSSGGRTVVYAATVKMSVVK